MHAVIHMYISMGGANCLPVSLAIVYDLDKLCRLNVKFIVSPQITLCRPERTGKACLSCVWAASMILSINNPVGLSKIPLSLSNRLSSQAFSLWLFLIFLFFEGGGGLVLLHMKDDRFLYHFPLFLPPFWHHLLHPTILLHYCLLSSCGVLWLFLPLTVPSNQLLSCLA